MNQRELKLVSEESISIQVDYKAAELDSFLKSDKDALDRPVANHNGDILLQFSANLDHLEKLQSQFRFMVGELKDVISR